MCVRRLADWQGLSFVELAQQIMPLFIDDIEPETLKRLVAESYASFDHDDVVGMEQLDDLTILELFHGPTLAFKDVALQLLGKLFEHVLGERGQRLNILGATSGDTGSAAIDGVRGQRNVDIFIMYPKGRVSPLQELQMTTVADENVHCIEVEGSFDDCQNIMKTVFADAEYKAKYQLGAVNSVNWARVLAQIVYYGYASLRGEQALRRFAFPPVTSAMSLPPTLLNAWGSRYAICWSPPTKTTSWPGFSRRVVIPEETFIKRCLPQWTFRSRAILNAFSSTTLIRIVSD